MDYDAAAVVPGHLSFSQPSPQPEFHENLTEPLTAFVPTFAPANPLSSLQAGLDFLNSRDEAMPPPQRRPAYADDLATVFNTAPSNGGPLTPDALATLASVVGQADIPPLSTNQRQSPPTAPARSEPVTRVRPVRMAPDLSKLPPGLAASLAKLAGTPVEQPLDNTAPPPVRKVART